jgi:IclR family transcriptional regulator, acetate operon repressor
VSAGDGTRQRNPVTRAFQLLGWMSGADGESSALGEIAAGVGMHPATVHRVLGQLVEEGLVRQDAASGAYGLGLEFLRLAWLASGRASLRDVAEPHLRALTADTGETAWLGLYEPSRRQMIFAAAVESPQPIRHVRPVNEWLPVHGGASGRTLLAFLPELEREAILTGPLEPVTGNTVTDPAELRRLLADVRRRGYAVSRGERVLGGVGVAAPILAGDGRLLGVIGVGLPAQRYRATDEPRLAKRVIAAADAVARAAGAAVAQGPIQSSRLSPRSRS